MKPVSKRCSFNIIYSVKLDNSNHTIKTSQRTWNGTQWNTKYINRIFVLNIAFTIDSGIWGKFPLNWKGKGILGTNYPWLLSKMPKRAQIEYLIEAERFPQNVWFK